MKTAIIRTLAIATAAISMNSFAADEYNTANGLTAAGAPLGFHGVDPVLLTTLENRHNGNAKYTEVHDGVAYYFSSKDSAKVFKKNPESYLPQNGGFCTFGVSVGKKFDGDPKYADIYNGKLYVFLNQDIFNLYQKDKAGTIAKATKKWQKIQHTAATTL